MKQHSKLQHKVEQGSESLNQAQAASDAKEFASVEEMLQFDAAQNPPPASLAERVSESIAKEPKRSPSLWGKIRQWLSR